MSSLPTQVDLALGALGFLQMSVMPLVVLVAQSRAKKLIGPNLLVEVLVSLAVCCVVLLIPFQLFGLTPLKGAAFAWVVGAVLGCLAAVPLTRFVRHRYFL